MATLREQLKGNPFAPIFIPIIAALQDTRLDKKTVAYAAQLVVNRLESWGGALTMLPRDAYPAPTATYTKKLYGIAGSNPTAIQTRLNALEASLKGMSMNSPNDYVYYVQGLDAFFTYVSFLEYFAVDYKQGNDTQYVLDSLNLFQRAGSSLTGLLVTTPQEGSDGPAKASTTIIVDSIVGGDDGKYFTAYSDDTNLEVVWLNVDGGGATPVLDPILGVTINYVPVVTGSGATPVELRASIRNAVNTAARMSAADGAGTDVIVSTLVNGIAKVTFDQDIPTTGTWAYAFVNGTLDPIQAEITEIDVSNVVPTDLAGKYLTMADGGRLYGIWFQIDGQGSVPAMPGVTDVVLVRANSEDGKIGIKTELDTQIADLGVWAIDSQTEFTTTWISLVTGIQVNSNAQTAGKGIANAEMEIYGADGTLLYSPPVGLTELPDAYYALIWNTVKVPYDKRNGTDTVELKSVDPTTILSGGLLGGIPGCVTRCGPRPFLTGNTQDQATITAYSEYNTCIAGCKGGSIAPPRPGVFLKTTRLAVGANLPFNTPTSGYGTVSRGYRSPL